MTNEQAGNCVAILNAAFPREALERETVVLYISEIALLNDYEVAFDAAKNHAREGARFPTIKEFRQTYRSLNEAKLASRPALPEPPRETRVPEWVHVWCWARRAKGERRMFPQQDEHGMLGWPSLSLKDYDGLVEEWRLAGAPQVSGMRDFLQAAA